MKNIFIAIIFITFYINNLSSQDINITFEQREISGNTWSFDLVAQILPSYTPNNNWSTMNVRTNISVPAGIVIQSVTPGVGLHNSVSSADGQLTFGGGTVPNTVKYAVALDRANSSLPDLLPNTTVTLASFSVTFSNQVPGSNLVTPRPFGVSAQSFWTRLGDPTARPFGLPAAFPLPIKMKSFSAIKDGERASRLDWVTSSEINSDYFGVERSADGNTWEQIGQVAAAGNSNTDIAYQFLDRKLPSFRAGENIFYYRLKLTDLDGQYKYSDVRGVNFGKLSNSIISIYPNPTTEIINVDISGMSLDAGDVTLSVFDMNGRNMISKNIIGNGIELIDVDQYPSGTYNVVVQQGETIQQKKIIKID